MTTSSLSRIWLRTVFQCLLNKGILDHSFSQCNIRAFSVICGEILATLMKSAVQAAYSSKTVLQVCKHWCLLS